MSNHYSAFHRPGTGITAKSLGYDMLGNITSKNDVGTYSYPSAGSAGPHAVASIAGTVNGVTNPSYTYDADGNLTAGAGRSLSYFGSNRVHGIVEGATATCFTYDADNVRLWVSVFAHAGCLGTLTSMTTYLNDPVSGAMSEKVTAGATTTWHDYLKVDGRIVAERFCTGAAPCTSGASWSWFVLDHLGSVAVVTDAAGTVTERDSYDAWGRRRNSDGTDNGACAITSATTRGYTGHEMIDAVCAVNANARIYDPTIGRFMSADDTIPDPLDGQSFNRYSYVNNRPLSLIDPSGHAPVADPSAVPNKTETVVVTDSLITGLSYDLISGPSKDLELQNRLGNSGFLSRFNNTLLSTAVRAPGGLGTGAIPQINGVVESIPGPGTSSVAANSEPMETVVVTATRLPGGTTSAITVVVGLQLGPIRIPSYQVGLARDQYGNMAWIHGPAGGSTLGPYKISGILGLNASLSNARTVDDLAGVFAEQNAQGGAGVVFGANAFEGNSPDGKVLGGGVTAGLGAGYSLDFGLSNTTVDVIGRNGGGGW